jgi:leucyl/phenylalanyl-tRNA---protein transferase
MGEPDIIPAATLLGAYSSGIFPMAEERDDADVFWVDPQRRGIFPLDGFKVPGRLARTMRASTFRMTVDTAFGAVMAACAEPAPQRPKTWISPLIERSYANLHVLGYAHSVEVWEDEELIGGLYGVAIGAAFFGESMFARRRDASKMALVHLVARLKAGRYTLLDTQFVTEHLKQFGAVEIARLKYQKLLRGAIERSANFYELGGAGAAVCVGTVLQLTTQTS